MGTATPCCCCAAGHSHLAMSPGGPQVPLGCPQLSPCPRRHFPHYFYSLCLVLGCLWGAPKCPHHVPKCPQVFPCPHRHFPHYFYSLRLSLPGTNVSARLLLLDTVLLCGGGDDAGGAPAGPGDAVAAAAQLRWLRGRLAASRGDRFVLLAGHYPLWSAGEHGPSSCLERLLRPLLRKHRVTAYLSGHDHNLQVRDPDPQGPLNSTGTT